MGIALAKDLILDSISRETATNLSVIAYLSDDPSPEGQQFKLIIRELLKIPPKHYSRVRAYLYDLNDNVAVDPKADPRKYAERLRAASEERRAGGTEK